MKAFILAGGLGTRLHPIVAGRPKSMAQIGGRPFLAYQLDLLRSQGFTEIILCTGYMSKVIEEHFGDGGDFGVQITYSVEGKPLGTAGAIKHAAHLVDGSFLVLNGDTYIQADLRDLTHFHQDRGALATIGLSRVGDPSRSGLVQVNDRGQVVRFTEKGIVQEECNTVSAGLYVFEPEILDFIPSGRHVSLELGVFPHLVEVGAPLYGYMLDGSFVDMGTPEGYRRMREFVSSLATAHPLTGQAKI
jgi:NDP-sugar pyrophosphorylase family protein